MTTAIAPPVQTQVGNYFVSNYPPYSCWLPERLGDIRDALQKGPIKEPFGLYVHLPFCRQRCSYCYFRVYPQRNQEDIDRYVEAVLNEAKLYKDQPVVAGRRLVSAYFGGGSPSYLSTSQISRLLAGLQSALPWDGIEECTYECDPGTTTLEKLVMLKSLGVTRVTLGFQSLNREIVARTGRQAMPEDCVRAFHQAREAGFDEINIDLLAGLPGETLESFMQTIEKVIRLEPDCVTIYQMELTHNSRLYAAMKLFRSTKLPSWPDKRELVGQAFHALEEAGYVIGSGYMAIRHPERWRFVYTVENYWHGKDLLALGETAFGYFQGAHYQNVDSFDEYTGLIGLGQFPHWRAYRLEPSEALRRELIFQLKTGAVDAAYFRSKFGVEVRGYFVAEFRQLQEDGLLEINGDQIRLMREGLLQVDWLLPAFYLPQHRGIRYT